MSSARKVSDTSARLFGLSTASTKSDGAVPSIRTDGVPSDLLPSVPLEAAPPPPSPPDDVPRMSDRQSSSLDLAQIALVPRDSQEFEDLPSPPPDEPDEVSERARRDSDPPPPRTTPPPFARSRDPSPEPGAAGTGGRLSIDARMKQLNWLDSAAEEARRQSLAATAAESAAAAAATAAATGAADASAAAVAPPPSPKASAPSPTQLPSMPPSLLYCKSPGGRAFWSQRCALTPRHAISSSSIWNATRTRARSPSRRRSSRAPR